MARRSFLRLNFVLSSALVVGGVLGFSAWVIGRFPWPVLHADFSTAKESYFLAHWPLPAIEEDKQERKKLRRFPKSEQQRRLGIIMRRMDYLNVPIFDFFMDPGVQYLSAEVPVGGDATVPLIWPSLPTARQIGSEDSSFKGLRYVVLPTSFGSQCLEGVQMVAADEIRLSLPPSRNKRNVSFQVLPLAPSNLRAWLGQFSWARQFNDSDVNKIQTVSIPVNDPAATALRLSLGTGKVFVVSGAISHWDRSGRLPVQVGTQSTIWRSANEKVQASGEAAELEAPAEDAAEEIVGLAPSVDKDKEKKSPTEVDTEKDKKSVPEVEVEKDKKTIADADSKKEKDKGKVSNVVDDLLDPETVKYNPVLSVVGDKTVALGYNTLLIQLDAGLHELISDEANLAALAPKLHAFLKSALDLSVQLPAHKSPSELFQSTIVRQNGEYVPVDMPILMKDVLASKGVFNLYQEYRNYGYKVVSFVPHAALSMPEALALGIDVPKIAGRWLDGNDWKFWLRRRELDQMNEPVTGLEAIFKNEQTSSVQAITETEFSKISGLLGGIESQSDGIPDWRANEIAVIHGQGQYLPRLVDGFQRWMRDNNQARFFAHVYLNNDDIELRPTFKDFLKVLKQKKLKALFLPSTAERLARLVMLDRVFGHLQDTLIARRTYHRTVTGVLLSPQKTSAKASSGRFFLNVPGLKARQKTADKNLKLDDALATMAQVVGVQFNSHDSQGRRVFRGKSIEPDSTQTPAMAHATVASAHDERADAETSDASTSTTDIKKNTKHEVASKESAPAAQAQNSTATIIPAELSFHPQASTQVSRFRMIVLPRAAGCQPFEWVASSEYFGLRSSQPIVEEPFPRGRVIRVFPCGLRDQVIELSWFQPHLGGPHMGFTAQNVGQWLGGVLRVSNNSESSQSADSPLFLVGPRALSLDSLTLKLQKYSPSEVPQIFDLGEGQNVSRETLARMLNLGSQIQGPQMTARTLVYFFREPLRR